MSASASETKKDSYPIKHLLILALAIVVILMLCRAEHMSASEYTALSTGQPMRFEYGVPVARIIKVR